MTAEIAVMNQSAVALAADSAATRSGAKIFAANKIFALSKYEPVAVMIYGSASCMNVPWETIVKEFRAGLDCKDFKTVKEYGQAFLRFLGSSDLLFPNAQQHEFASWAITHKLSGLREMAVQQVDMRINERGPVGIREARRVVREAIERECNAWRAPNLRQGLPKDYLRRLRSRYAGEIDKIINEVFENFRVTADLRKK